MCFSGLAKLIPTMEVDGGVFGDVVGAPWERLFPLGREVSDPQGAPPPAGRSPPRSPCDVKRLPARDMRLFGRCPESDPFYTVVCELCGTLVMPHALRRHMLKRHGDAVTTLKAKTVKPKSSPIKKIKSASSSPPEALTDETRLETESASVFCSLCSLSVPAASFRRHALKVHGDDSSAKPLLTAALKIKTAKKPSPPKKTSYKSASASPPELTDEISKEIKKPIKSKKCKSPIPPELEPILPPGKRIGLTGGPPDLMPVDLPKKSNKKKMERKVDKVYDPNKNCGVINDAGKPCLRSILCKVHLVAHKRAVQNRAMPYDALTKLLKSQSDEERRPKLELTLPTPTEAPPMCVLTVTASEVWSEPPCIEAEEPHAKRLKTEELEEDQYADLPSDLDALIEATLKDVEENEPLAMIPVVPRPEPLLRWSLEAPVCPPTPPPPPLMLADLPWHPTHPRPLATNTFGCRLVGGLMTKCKKLDAFRKHVQSVWSSPAMGVTDSPTKLPSFSVKQGAAPLVKKAQVAAPRRKRKSSSSVSGGGASELITGLLQRAAANAATAPPNGVNGVPLRLFPGNLPGTQPAFIQLNLCPSK